MDKKVTNFAVNSNGYCFFCMHKISSWSHSPPTLNPSSVYSLQDISRYVKLDMRKVFFDQGPVPPHLLAKVKKSRLKVELCEECAFMTESISRQCRQLEKLILEIESGLDSIHVKMSEADETGRTKQFRETVTSVLGLGMGGCIEVLEVLRMETIQKCSYLKSAATPRPKIKRLSSGTIRRETSRIPKEKPETSSEQMTHYSGSGLQRPINNIKIEEPEPDVATCSLEEDNDSYCSFGNDLNNDAEDSISVSVKREFEPVQIRADNRPSIRKREVTTGNNPQRKWVMNPQTGKYKCKLCSKEYSCISSVYHHYDAVHRKIRIKCKICGKNFSRQDVYKIHHRNVHEGVRFQCQGCKMIFTQKNNLLTHQREMGCVI